MRWRKRPFAAAADQEWVERLWRAAMPPSWPMLPAGIALLTEGRVAEAGPHLAGFVAADMAGAISLILVDPLVSGAGSAPACWERPWTRSARAVPAA